MRAELGLYWNHSVVHGVCSRLLMFVEFVHKVIIYKDRMLVSLHMDQKTRGNVGMAGQPPQFMLVRGQAHPSTLPKCF